MSRTKRTDLDGTKVPDGKQYLAMLYRSDPWDHAIPHKRVKLEFKGDCPRCRNVLEVSEHSNMTVIDCTVCDYSRYEMTEQQEKDEYDYMMLMCDLSDDNSGLLRMIGGN